MKLHSCKKILSTISAIHIDSSCLTLAGCAEKLDVALDFGWSSASALHNWRVFIDGFTGCGKLDVARDFGWSSASALR
jgi:hypothetical protein